MKKYKLKYDMPKYKAGTEFRMTRKGHLAVGDMLVFHSNELKSYPEILEEWFEEIPEQPETVWDLKEGDECYILASSTIVCEAPHAQMVFFKEPLIQWREAGEVFLTRRDAEKRLARQRAEAILLRDAKGFKPDWGDKDQRKFSVYYDHTIDALFVDWDYSLSYGRICFATEEDVRASVRAHEKEWKTYLGVEE